MDLNFERTIVHNQALGATAIWHFSRAYFDTLEQTAGPTLPEALLVLPIVFHKRSADVLHRMRQASGLAKALLDEPELPVGLQRRLEGFAEVSLRSLSLAVSSGLLRFDRDEPWPRYLPAQKTIPTALKPLNADVKQVCDAATRLGWWLANEELSVLCSLLRVRF